MELSGKLNKGNKGECSKGKGDKVSFVLLTKEDRDYLTNVIWLFLDGLVVMNPNLTKEYVQDFAKKWKALASSPTKSITLYGALTDTLNKYYFDEHKQLRDRLTLKACTLVDILMEVDRLLKEVSLESDDFLVEKGTDELNKSLVKIIDESGFIYKSYPDYYLLAIKDRDLNILLREPTFTKVLDYVYGKDSDKVKLIQKYISEDLKIKNSVEAVDINVLDADLSLLLEYICELKNLPIDKAKSIKKKVIRIHKITVNNQTNK